MPVDDSSLAVLAVTIPVLVRCVCTKSSYDAADTMMHYMHDVEAYGVHDVCFPAKGTAT